ncbi:hypothetical protein [Streptomyces sp. NBC_00059]|uniref:hypothetical protein n=1 Tax=Streptomyces sp. NBC_00059 TaxID=2975635 RepID=UPI00225A1698|nr:hypothetical protein [Streptomyces sp. NBC_00059]MCX5410507.1 hypothetical protein [Streptomyces sp. NBC_00059]
MTHRRSAALAAAALLSVLVPGCAAQGVPEGTEAAPVPASPTVIVPPSGAPEPRPVPTTAAPATPARSAPPRSSPAPGTPPGPDLSRTAVPPAPARPEPGRRTAGEPASPAPAGTSAPPARAAGSGTTLRIGDWSAKVVRGGQDAVDACRSAVQWAGPDFGTENGYAMRTIVVVGHDHCGFQQFATLPVGTVVTVETPRTTLRYTVYTRYLTPGRGTPAHGLYWGDLTLQSCVGQDTGFTYLTRTR